MLLDSATTKMAIEDETPLQTSFTFTCMRRGGKSKASASEEGGESKQEQTVVHPYENSIRCLATVSAKDFFEP